MTETKNEALELAQELSVAAVDGTLSATMGRDAADMLRSQAAEIKRLEYEIWNMKEMAKGYSNGS